MAKSVTTICRTVAIAAVWYSSCSFLSNGLPMMGMRMVDNEVLPFYAVSIITVMIGAVTATAILWLAGRRKRNVPSPDRAFEVIRPSSAE